MLEQLVVGRRDDPPPWVRRRAEAVQGQSQGALSGGEMRTLLAMTFATGFLAAAAFAFPACGSSSPGPDGGTGGSAGSGGSKGSGGGGSKGSGTGGSTGSGGGGGAGAPGGG